jgi:hypothetical protein
MQKRITTALAIIVMLVVAGAPLFESTALAATKKRACSCSRPSLRRRARRTAAVRTPHAATNPNANAAQDSPNAQVVGPVTATYHLETNQYFRLRMNQTLRSDQARMGDRFKATVVTPVYASGVEVVPAGSIVEGRVTRAIAARTRGREGQLAVAFDTLVLPDGSRHPLDGVLTELQDDRRGEVDAENEVSGRSSDKRNIEYVGGGAVGGAILGGIAGGGKGAGIGAILGAGAGVAGVMLTKGNDAELRSGTEVGMTTTRPMSFTIRTER